MDARELPARPSLEDYQRVAHDLVAGWAGDAAALRRIGEFFQLGGVPDRAMLHAYVGQRLSKLRPGRARDADLSLAEAQALVADQHAFASWDDMNRHIAALNDARSPEARFEAAADAVITGDVATLSAMLRADAELVRARSTRKHGSTLLHYTSANGVEDFRQKTPPNAVAVARLLLATGAEVDAENVPGHGTTLGLVATSVHPLVAGVQIALLETLVEAGAAVDGLPGGWNPLIAALHNGRGEAAAFLAERGARLDLEGAAGVGRLDVVQSHFDANGRLQHGATPEQLKSGYTWACEYGRTAVVEFLLRHGAAVDPRLQYNGQTGLHWAAFGGHADLVQLLLAQGAPVNARDESFDGTPLGWAVYGWGETRPGPGRERYYEVVERLVAAGATVDPAWLDEEDRGMPLEKMAHGDPRMLAALRQSL